MARDNYDDWNIGIKEKQVEHFNIKGVSFIFFICVLTLIITSIVNVFSVTFVGAIESGLPSYSYVIYYLIYIAVGLIAGFLCCVLPRALVNTFAFLISITGIGLLLANAGGKTSFTFDETIYCLIILSNIIYLSSFFAKRSNKIEKLAQMTTPVIIGTATFTGILFNGNLTFSLFYLIVILMVFRKGGVNYSGLLLFLIYIVVPIVFWSLSKQSNLNAIYRFISLKPVSTLSQHSMRLNCLVNSGLLGKGIGLGEYKSLAIDGIAGPYIICNIVNEAGYVGAFLILCVLIVMTTCLFRFSAYSLNTDTYASNLTGIFSSYILLQVAFNILQTLDILPLEGVSLPFYSFGFNIALMILMCMLSYKCMHHKTANKAEKSNDFDVDIEFDEVNGKKKD